MLLCVYVCVCVCVCVKSLQLCLTLCDPLDCSLPGLLRKQAEAILDELKDIELRSIKKLKKIYSKFLSTRMEEFKDDALLEFITDDDSYEYLERLFTCIEEDLVNCYTMSIELPR